MDFQLKGGRALVTCNSTGIGKAIGRMLAKEGATVVDHDRNSEPAEKMANEIGATGFAIG